MPVSVAPHRRSVARVLAAALVALAAVGCGQTTVAPSASTAVSPSPAPSSAAASATTAVSPSLTAVPTASGPAPSPATGQTDTEWGRIWDALPRSFPVYPGAMPTTDVGSPASAQLVISADVPTATTWMTSALNAAGFETDVSGPLEDGSMTLDSTRPGTPCKAQTTIAKQGGTTVMTVLYGADCPFS